MHESQPCFSVSHSSGARNPQWGCDQEVEKTSPLCGHQITVACRLRVELGVPLWDQDQFTEICNTGMINEMCAAICKFDSLSAEAESSLQKCQGKITLTLRCGHVKEFPCASILRMLRDRNYRCPEQVLTALRCGHNSKVSCSRAKLYVEGKADIQCKEMTSKPCWNHSSCGVELVMQCGFEGPVACKNPTVWSCPLKKHSYEINQCSEGPPLACPGCSLDSLDDTISEGAPIPSRDVFVNHLGVLSPSLINWLDPIRSAEFLENEREMLEGFKTFVDSESIPVWTRPLFRLNRVPCFRVLRGPLMGLDWFDPKKLVKQRTIHGILMAVFSENSLNWLISTLGDNEVTLLFGYASVSRTMISKMKDFPQKAKKRNQLFKAVQGGEYDSLSFVDSHGCDRLLVCEPFPLVAIGRLRLRREQLQLLAHHVAGSAPPRLKEARISLKSVPENLLLSTPVIATSAFDDLDEQSVASNGEEVEELEGTSLEGFDIDRSWNKTCGIKSEWGYPQKH